jgi:hypothetical protein
VGAGATGTCGVSGVEGAGGGCGGVSSAPFGFATSGAGGGDVSGWAGFAAGLSGTLGGAGGGVWRAGGGGGGIDDGGCVFGAGAAGSCVGGVSSPGSELGAVTGSSVASAALLAGGSLEERSMADIAATDAESTGEDDAGSGCAEAIDALGWLLAGNSLVGRTPDDVDETDAESTVEDDAGPVSADAISASSVWTWLAWRGSARLMSSATSPEVSGKECGGTLTSKGVANSGGIRSERCAGTVWRSPEASSLVAVASTGRTSLSSRPPLVPPAVVDQGANKRPLSSRTRASLSTAAETVGPFKVRFKSGKRRASHSDRDSGHTSVGSLVVNAGWVVSRVSAILVAWSDVEFSVRGQRHQLNRPGAEVSAGSERSVAGDDQPNRCGTPAQPESPSNNPTSATAGVRLMAFPPASTSIDLPLQALEPNLCRFGSVYVFIGTPPAIIRLIQPSARFKVVMIRSFQLNFLIAAPRTL